MGQPVCDPQGIARKPHICCVPVPCAPSLFKGSSLWGTAKPKKEPCFSAGLRRGDATALGRGACAAAETAIDGSRSNTSKGPCASAPDSVREASKSAASEVKLDWVKKQPIRSSRAAFTDEQLRKLKNTFRKQVYLMKWETRDLAAELHVTEVQVRNWFRNHRMKLKQQQQDMKLKKQQQDDPRCHWPSFPLCLLCHPKIPASQPDEFAMYSPQSIPPFMPNPALRFNLSGCKYQPFQNPLYPFLLPRLPYHLLPQVSGNSTEECKVESKQTFPPSAFGYGIV